jgi:cadherin 23
VFAIIDGNEDRLFDFEQSPPNAAKLISRFSLRGRVGNYTVTVKASDGGQPQLSSTAKVHICVTDVNDHNPVFVKPPSNITIRIAENATIGSTVVDVKATDEDTGVNAVIRYKLRQLPNNHWKSFAINDVTGVITVAKQLDREAQRVHELRVQAYDMGEPTSLSTDLDLTILVANVDDFEPEFTQDVFQMVFTENTLPGIYCLICLLIHL